MTEPEAEPPEPAEAPAEPEAKVPKFPKQILFVLGNELCERFSFYGMRAVLILYLKRELEASEETTKNIYHSFNMMNYFIPLFGGLLADIYLGKFKTIFYVSLVYASGNIFLSLITIPQLNLNPKIPLVIVALVTIAIGAGGIKPCVASFGGDQFVKGQEYMRERFFSIFYFCINIGAALSMILSPIFRAEVSCFGLLECYPLAFGFPALLMVIATILFLIGKHWYIIYPPQGTAVIDVVRCIAHSIVKRPKATEKKPHWLDYADDKFSPEYLEDVKTVLSIFVLFTPMPMFWALFSQQGSTWTLQSAKLDGRVAEGVEIQPDQMDSMNAILVVVMIPLFTFGLYPLLAKCKLLRTPLQKMTTGGFLAAISFLVGGFIQLAIEARLPNPPPAGTANIMIINTMNCPLDIKMAGSTIRLKAYEHNLYLGLKSTNIKGTLLLSESCLILASNKTELASNETELASNETELASSESFKFKVKFRKAYSVAIVMTPDGIKVGPPEEQMRVRESSKALPFVRFIYTGEKPYSNATLLLDQEGVPEESQDLYQEVTFDEDSVFSSYTNIYSLLKTRVCWAKQYTDTCSKRTKFQQEISIYKGGIADYLLISKKNGTVMQVKEMMSHEPDSIHILIQTPMYIIITSGEVMLSISGLTFAYAEAPSGMKAVMQSAWLMTNAIGNLIVLIIVAIKKAVAAEALESTYFFIFAALMTVDMVLFTILAIRYKYISKIYQK